MTKHRRIVIAMIFAFLASHAAQAVGGEWFLEIEYTLKGHRLQGYVRADQWADDYERLIGYDFLFDPEFRSHYASTDSLKVFSKLIDHEKIAAAASFPMHSFSVVEESAVMAKIGDLKNVSLKKVWKRIAYMINVLTRLSESDTSWIGGRDTVLYPVGDEVSCRLAVHLLGGRKGHESLVRELATIYPGQKPLRADKKNRYHQILNELKKRKAVVVELCGC